MSFFSSFKLENPLFSPVISRSLFFNSVLLEASVGPPDPGWFVVKRRGALPERNSDDFEEKVFVVQRITQQQSHLMVQKLLLCEREHMSPLREHRRYRTLLSLG